MEYELYHKNCLNVLEVIYKYTIYINYFAELLNIKKKFKKV